MSTRKELFAPAFIGNGPMTEEAERAMATELKADTLRYLPVARLADAIDLSGAALCQACVTGTYPTEDGQRLYQLSVEREQSGQVGRTYEAAHSTGANERTCSTESISLDSPSPA